MTLVIDSSFAYKAEMCPLFENERYCPEENDCLYAHGLRELRSAENPLYKTQMCTAYEQESRCRMGDHCLFAHGEDELRDLSFPTSQITKVSPVATSQTQRIEPVQALQPTTGNSARKTQKTCTYFMKYGECTKGDDCRFAHIRSEGVNVLSQQSSLGVFPSLLQQPMSNATKANQEQRNSTPDPKKFKTRLCIPFLRNNRCMNKDKCNFAHDESELRVNPASTEGAVTDAKESGSYKTQLCKNYEKSGDCFLAESCMFAHSRYELRPKGFKGDFEEKIKKNPNWKCSLCDIFQRNGSCQRGECNYAHGPNELRSSKKPEKPDKQSSSYKRALCKEFSTAGFCRNGGLCLFAHGEAELRGQNNANLNPANSMMQFVSNGTGPQFVQQSSDQGMGSRKRGAEGTGVLEQMASVMMSASSSSSGNEMSDDMKMFAEFLQFKKFKKASEQIMAQASASPEPAGYPQLQQTVQNRSMSQQWASGSRSVSGSDMRQSGGNTVYVPFEYTY